MSISHRIKLSPTQIAARVATGADPHALVAANAGARARNRRRSATTRTKRTVKRDADPGVRSRREAARASGSAVST